MNQYPKWKYLLIICVLLVGGLYAMPNLFGEDPAVQISASSRGTSVDQETTGRVASVLDEEKIPYKKIEFSGGRMLIRFSSTNEQLKAKDLLREHLGRDYVVALNLAPATPAWLRTIDAEPMYLGLDLRGGVHFLMEVDMDTVITQAEESYISELKSVLRNNKVRYLKVLRKSAGGISIKLKNHEDKKLSMKVISESYPELLLEDGSEGGAVFVQVNLSEREKNEARKFALQQNITTLRNRVNELGVAEPIIQQQGEDRVVVQLPGVQDTARAKEILGATATLEFRMVDEDNNPEAASRGGTAGSRLYRERNGTPVLLSKRVIITGDSITDASSGIDQTDGSPAVFIRLDGKGGRKMGNTTKANVGKLMAVVFIENKIETKIVDGETVKHRNKVEEVINIARIRGQFSNRFQITGLDSTDESRDLALLLRAGALSAPIYIVEERTVGPSLGQDNIDQGFLSVMTGFLLVLVFMAFWYRRFGWIANLALGLNLVIIVALLSLLQATLTLPGIAGIVLTVGMAVDANVLIFERIREEIRNGNTPQTSIHVGYGKAFVTIADANITTLIAAVVLYGIGTGPIKGFAITLSIGILTSMFTAIMVSRSVVNLMYGGRQRVTGLSI